jgi:hypothetical protein
MSDAPDYLRHVADKLEAAAPSDVVIRAAAARGLRQIAEELITTVGTQARDWPDNVVVMADWKARKAAERADAAEA